MFVVTLDAVVGNVALPSIRRDFGVGITALQGVVDRRTGARRVADDGHLAVDLLHHGAIEAGAQGFTATAVLTAFVCAAGALAAFLVNETRVEHPMVPLDLFRSRNVSVSVAVGFASVVGYDGLPFLMSLYLQQLLNSVPDHQAGVASAVFNTGRQIGGALAVAVFGALLTAHNFKGGRARASSSPPRSPASPPRSVRDCVAQTAWAPR